MDEDFAADRPTLEESVLASLDGRDPGLLPFLPYILQDIWELGASPGVVAGLFRRNVPDHSGKRVLDLGCGKGPVAVRLAEEFSCTCLGIDALAEFIAEARRRAEAHGVAHLCRFERGDIRERLPALAGFDLIVLGAIGPVLGDLPTTLRRLAPCLAPGGLVVVDDGYDRSGEEGRDELLARIAAGGMEIVAEVVSSPEEVREENARIFTRLKQRCDELADGHPEKRGLFAEYVRLQEEENRRLERDLVCTTMALRRGGS